MDKVTHPVQITFIKLLHQHMILHTLPTHQYYPQLLVVLQKTVLSLFQIRMVRLAKLQTSLEFISKESRR